MLPCLGIKKDQVIGPIVPPIATLTSWGFRPWIISSKKKTDWSCTVPTPLIIESTHHSSLPLNTPNNHADPNATNHWRAKALALAMRTLKRPLLEPQQTCSPCAKAALASCARQKVFILKFGLQQNEGHGRPSKQLYQLSIFNDLHLRCSPLGKCGLCRLFLIYKSARNFRPPECALT